MKIFTLLSLLMLLSAIAKPQKIQLDLSTGDKTNLTQTIDPMVIEDIVLVNRLPKGVYTYTIEKIKQKVPALPGFKFANVSDTSFFERNNVCDSLVQASKVLANQKDETQIPLNIKALENEIKRANSVTCQNQILDANKLIFSTRQTFPLPSPLNVTEGDIVKIIIKRDTLSWTYEFKTEQINRWKVYFGFTYVPDMISKFDNYYAKSTAESTYLVSRMNSNNTNVLRNISPTVFFTYRGFHKKEDAPLKFGATGGFMYDLETLGAMIGPSLVIGENITVNVGLATLQKHRLMGQYAEGQSLKETLNFDQLHEKVWTYDVFFSVGFNIPNLFDKTSEKKKKNTED